MPSRASPDHRSFFRARQVRSGGDPGQPAVRHRIARVPPAGGEDSTSAANRAMDVVVANDPEPPIASAAHALRLAVRLAERIDADQAARRGAIARATAARATLTPREEKEP